MSRWECNRPGARIFAKSTFPTQTFPHLSQRHGQLGKCNRHMSTPKLPDKCNRHALTSWRVQCPPILPMNWSPPVQPDLPRDCLRVERAVRLHPCRGGLSERRLLLRFLHRLRFDHRLRRLRLRHLCSNRRLWAKRRLPRCQVWWVRLHQFPLLPRRLRLFLCGKLRRCQEGCPRHPPFR